MYRGNLIPGFVEIDNHLAPGAHWDMSLRGARMSIGDHFCGKLPGCGPLQVAAGPEQLAEFPWANFPLRRDGHDAAA